MMRGSWKRKSPVGIFVRREYDSLKRAATGQIVPIPPTTGFNAHDGEVMAFPRVRAIYWGSSYGSVTGGLNALGQQLDSFFASIIPSVYFGFLAEYSVNNPVFLGSVWLPHDSGSPVAVTPSTIISTLTSWLEGGLLPEVPGRTEENLLYIVFLSPEMTVTTSSPGCAFHYWGFYQKGSGKQNLFVAAVGSGSINSLTGAASHELVEAFTDRSNNGWYSDDSTPTNPNPEIADDCSCCGCMTLALNGFALASYWRNSVGNCLQQEDLTPPPPRTKPVVTVEPFPITLGSPTSFNVQAANPVNQAKVTGGAVIMQPRVVGANIQNVPVANFRVPGISPQLTLNRVVLRTKTGTTEFFPFGAFTPDDQTDFENVNFNLVVQA